MTRENIKIWAPSNDLAYDIKEFLERNTYIHDNTKVIAWEHKDEYNGDTDDRSAIVIAWDMPVHSDRLVISNTLNSSNYFKNLTGYNKEKVECANKISLSIFIATTGVTDADMIGVTQYDGETMPKNQFIILPFLKEYSAENDFNLSDYFKFTDLANKVSLAIAQRKLMKQGINEQKETLNTCSYTM